MVSHERLIYFEQHKYAGPIKTFRGILDLFEKGLIPKEEAIRIFQNCLTKQEKSLNCLVKYSGKNEPDYLETMNIQEHRQIYDECEKNPTTPETLTGILYLKEFVNENRKTGN